MLIVWQAHEVLMDDFAARSGMYVELEHLVELT